MIKQGKHDTEPRASTRLLAASAFFTLSVALASLSPQVLASSVTATQIRANSHREHDSALPWQSWQQVGQARLSMVFFDIYDSTLFSPDGHIASWPNLAKRPTALSITYLRAISAQELLSATKAQWQKLGFSQTHIARWLATLQAIFPDVVKGDSLTYLSQNQRGEFWFRSNAGASLIGEVEDAGLNEAFLAIWLSPSTAYPTLRAQLLGETQ